MTIPPKRQVRLALDASARERGWVVFKDSVVIENGVTGLSTRRKLKPEVRISHIVQSLNELSDRREPQAVALCQPSGINWPAPALELLVSLVTDWSPGRGLPQYSYTAQEVRSSIAGHANAPRDQ